MFQFKQFTIRQDKTAMKVGTDGVLLGAWVDLEGADTVLDIGTGTGLIALMAAQRNRTAAIDAIEIEEQACEQARENAKASPWSNRIRIIQSALQQYYPSLLYDCIVCNPPFFSHSTKTPDSNRTLARHNDTLPPAELVDHVKRLLKPDGHFSLILPVAEAMELIEYACRHHLYPRHITYVHPTPQKAPKRMLVQLTHVQHACTEDNITIELSRHRYSEAYTSLTKAFYLHM